MKNNTIEDFNKLSVSERMKTILSDKENIHLVNDYLKENGFEISETDIKKFIKSETKNTTK